MGELVCFQESFTRLKERFYFSFKRYYFFDSLKEQLFS